MAVKLGHAETVSSQPIYWSRIGAYFNHASSNPDF
jgi:hypothetical protein